MFRGSSSVGQITIIVGADGSPSTFQTIPSGNPVQVLTSGVYHFSGDVPQTALVMAAENGHVEVVKLLLLAGAHRGGRAQLYMGQIIGTGSKLEQAGFINFHVWTVNESALEAAKHANQQKVLDLLTPPSSSSALVNPKQ